MKKAIFVAIAVLVIPACSGQSENETAASRSDQAVPGKEVAKVLEGAAQQSGAAGKEVLEGAAEVAEDQPLLEPVDKPGSFAQDAMQAAGNAESRAAEQNKTAN